MANDEDDNEIPVDIPDEIEQEAEDILEEMDSNLEKESPNTPFLGGGANSVGHSFQDGFRDGVREADSNVDVDEVMGEVFGLFDGDEMSRDEKVIHALQSEPEYLLKTIVGGVVLHRFLKYGGRKVGISDYTLGMINSTVGSVFTNWMIDRYDP